PALSAAMPFWPRSGLHLQGYQHAGHRRPPGTDDLRDQPRGHNHREWAVPTDQLSGTTSIVTGASRGFGRAIATALSKAGAEVVGVARDRARLEDLRGQL